MLFFKAVLLQIDKKDVLRNALSTITVRSPYRIGRDRLLLERDVLSHKVKNRELLFGIISSNYSSPLNVSLENDRSKSNTQIEFRTDLDQSDRGLFKIQPVPAKDVLHIENASSEISLFVIYNSNGMNMLENNLEPGLNKIDVSGFRSGMYSITFYMNGKNIESEKLIINN